jgi:hypothetical protein
MPNFLWIFMIVVLTACAGKTTEAPVGTVSSGQQEPAAVQRAKPPAEVSTQVERSQSGPGVFFADLQLLTETLASSGCDGTEKIADGRLDDFIFEVSGEDLLSTEEILPKVQAYNMRVQAIGYDEARFRGSIRDDAPAAWQPYDFRIRLRPGSVVQIRFFDQTHNIDLATVPILSFQATEKRSAQCEITHNVNLFAEKAARFTSLKAPIVGEEKLP